MDILTGTDEDGEITFPADEILSTDLKRQAGFGKGGEKNYPGIVTGLQMQTYLVITDFHRRTNKRGEEYGMPVSVMLPPEAIWGYEAVTSAYNETPVQSWERIFKRVQELYHDADEESIVRIIGKAPKE